MTGKVFLVGAGPGARSLITLRGIECLRRADIVLYDGLANPGLLAFAAHAELLCVGKHGSLPLWTQSAIHAEILKHAQAGRTVVRLKGGDPAVFARTSEELQALIEAGIEFEVVPGITAALAASSYAGIPLTHRDHSSAVAFVTGQQKGESPQPIDWEALARFPGTLVFYMGVTTAEQWTSRLMDAGKPPGTPAAIVRRCTWADQQVIRCTLADVAAHLTPASRMRPPVLTIVGESAGVDEGFDWFRQQPLAGCGVLVTRAIDQADELNQELTELGASVYHQPAFEVRTPADSQDLDSAVAGLRKHKFQGVTFASPNAVRGLMNHLFATGGDARLLYGVTLAAVGPGTAASLQAYGLRCDIVPPPDSPSGYSAQSLAELLSDSSQGHSLDGEHWLVTTTPGGKETLAHTLRKAGAKVTAAVAYVTERIDTLQPGIEYLLQRGEIQVVTITSRLVAEGAYNLLAAYRDHVQPIAMSRDIAQRLEQLGWPAVATAAENSTAALVTAMRAWWKRLPTSSEA